MTILVVGLAVVLVALAALYFRDRLRRPNRTIATGPHRILFPFAANELSPRALDAALRLARAEDATLVPVLLARVPLQLPLDAPLPRQCNQALPLLEAVEQRAANFGVAVDSRVERGRTDRHALSQTIAHERFDRIVIAAAANGDPGFDADDVAWLLRAAPGEILILRPDKRERIEPPLTGRRAVRRARGDGIPGARSRIQALH